MNAPKLASFIFPLVLFGCAASTLPPSALTPATAYPRVVLAEGAPRGALAWADFTPATFAKAKKERRYVVLDGSAEWCHWCHVMEATTYHDPAVAKLLAERFIAVKVDVDARPDLEERYGDYGWPATVIFSPDAAELGKYRGYIAPEKFATILRQVIDSNVAEKGIAAAAGKKKPAILAPYAEEHLLYIQHMVEVELDEFYDEKRGGWGRTQKAPLAMDNAWALWRAKIGDADTAKKAYFTLDQQAKLIDPVWGGIYQYSAAANWDHAHFEKLMPFQAGALDNYAVAYQLSHQQRYLDLAKKMQAYLDGFMKSNEGGFYATQDADLNAHEVGKPFMNGHDYYALDDAHRRAAGFPRIDKHEYARDNGLAISAYCTLFEATQDKEALATAEKAAKRVLATHASAKGGLAHDMQAPDAAARVLHLADNAAFGFALMRLFEATKKPEYLEGAKKIADFLMKDLEDKDGGAFYAHTADPDAVGVFAERRTPFEDNVMALRFLVKLAGAAPSDAIKRTIGRALRSISSPEEIKGRGRMLGDFILALEETKGIR